MNTIETICKNKLSQCSDSDIIKICQNIADQQEYIENVPDAYKVLYTLQFVVSRGEKGALQSNYLIDHCIKTVID